MLYVTGIHALNTMCSLETEGDWHTSAIQWHTPITLDSDLTTFKEWGIELGEIPTEEGTIISVYKADHIRAILDILAREVRTPISYLKFFKDNFLVTNKYDTILFEKVNQLQHKDNWDEINSLMACEFGRAWLEYKPS